MKHNLVALAVLARMDKPVGYILLLWPAMWSLWIASGGYPTIQNTIVFLLGVFVMRSAGCVVNDLFDRDFDKNVERTRKRPLVTNEIKNPSAIAFFLLLLLLAAILLFFLNKLAIELALFAFVLTIVYPLMKRFTYLPQVILGLAFSMCIPMAFAQVQQKIPNVAWLLVIANLVWVVAYDTIYAMVDRDDDIKIGVKSTAILVGEYDKLFVGALQLATLAIFLLVSRQMNFSYVFDISVVVAAVLFGYQHRLIRNRERQKCLAAFLHNQWVGLVIFIGIVLQYEMSV